MYKVCAEFMECVECATVEEEEGFYQGVGSSGAGVAIGQERGCLSGMLYGRWVGCCGGRLLGFNDMTRG